MGAARQLHDSLTVNGKTFTQPLELKMDPRLKASAADLAEQFALSKQLYDLRPQLESIGKQFDALNGQIAKAEETAASDPAVSQAIDDFSKKLQQFAPPPARPGAPLVFQALANAQSLFGQLQGVDAKPRPAVKAAVETLVRDVPGTVERWRKLLSEELASLNQQLQQRGIPPVRPND